MISTALPTTLISSAPPTMSPTRNKPSTSSTKSDKPPGTLVPVVIPPETTNKEQENEIKIADGKPMGKYCN